MEYVKGYVKSAAEVERINRTLSNPRFTDAQAISVDFATSPDVLAELLPPGLEPTDEPIASARIGRWRSNCVGDFTGAGLYVRARHDDIVGDYVVAMWMSTGPSVTFGREVFGEPKRLGKTFLAATADGAAGWAERDGVRLISLRAVLDQDLGPTDVVSRTFTYKAQVAPDGSGLLGDAALVVTHFERSFRVRRRGAATLELNSGPMDPVATIPVVEVLEATYIEGDFSSRAEVVATVPAGEFLPYAYGSTDDWSLLSSR